MNKKINVIGAMLDAGASKKGCRLAPTALQLAGLLCKLKQHNFLASADEDIVFVADDSEGAKGCDAKDINLNNLAKVNQLNSKLFDKAYQALCCGKLPLVLGGDHSISIGSISAAQKFYKNVGIIWVDAHGDFNNEASSPSGNIHGMPLSALCGLGPNQTLPFVDNDHSFTSPIKAAIIGARELDITEKDRLKEHGVHVFSISDIDKKGINAITQMAIEIASKDTEGIYLSFDIDALDPFYAPGVGTPSQGGLTFREARLICELLSSSGRVIGIDFVEYNPIFDCDNKTALATIELILSALGVKIF